MFNEPLVAELVDRADVVFHLAAAVGVKLIVEQPVHTIETNVHGTEVVLQPRARRRRSWSFIASTSEVYGKSTDVPFREDADLVLGATTRHRWAYACSKALDEFLALAYWKERQLPVDHRALLQHGRARARRASTAWCVPTFVRQALAGEPITVFGDGTQSRSFTYVGDVVGALLKLMVEPQSDRRGVQHRQHRGSHASGSWPSASRRHGQLARRSSRFPTTRPTRPASRTCRGGCRNCRRSTRLIGYEPAVGLDEIIRRVVDSQRDV